MCHNRNILNSAITQAKKNKRPLYLTFLDVAKAYDKAWLNAILYKAHNSGLKGKYWRILRDLNTNLTANIKTKYGFTKNIKIKDSIRQGGVLSVIEYSNLIDTIAKELDNKNQGKTTVWDTNITGCLLWMDDVVLFHEDPNEF